ncbi:MAG: orotate phosphoribosyltransferase [Atribacterota bacterium]
MEKEVILDLFRKAGAFLEGHFLLTSGLHSPYYVEKFKLLQYPQYVEQLAKAIAENFKEKHVDVVVGPAVGGIILAYEVARAFGVRMAFTEREEGKMRFRRDFTLSEKDCVLVVEDVVTTGASLLEVIEAVRDKGASIVGVGVLVDRSGGKVSLPYPYFPLLTMEMPVYTPDECPLCKESIALQKRGSRYIT